MKKSAFLTTAVAVAVVVLAVVGGRATGFDSSAAADVGLHGRPFNSIPASDSPGQRTTIAAIDGPTGDSFLEAKPAMSKFLSRSTGRVPKEPAPKPAAVAAADVPGAGGAADAVAQGESQAEVQAAPEPQGCPGDAGGGVGGAPGYSSAQGVAGTTSDDLASFAYQYNGIRIANCLQPIPYGNFYYDSCMEERLFWMAESPSADPLDAWGHMGSVRADGVPSAGCDGNLAGGSDNSGATVAQKWWDSYDHRVSLYRPDSGVDGVCIAFAMTHGGIDEPYSFTRSAARWTGC